MHPHKKYIYFETLDFSNSPITSGYSLPISVFKFKPVFDDGFSNLYSNQSIYWDFGDGQISSDIEPTHYYTLPGWYNVSCYVLATSGEAFASSFTQSIYVKNYISDTIAVSAYTTGKIEEGVANRLLISRFNSWQSYSSVSAHGGYTIILNISGNNAPYLDADTYKNDKWIHLKATSRFLVEEYNVGLQIFEKIPVNSIKTLHNVELYAKISGTNIVLCDKNDVGSCFVGTSGYRELWYIDDLPKSINDDNDRVSLGVITFKFDTSNFKDPDNYFVDFPEQKYPVLNIMSGESGFHKALSALSGQKVVASITSNGIDTDSYGNTITTFDINPEKFLNTKISIVVRVRGGENNYFKSMGKLRLYQDIFLSLVYEDNNGNDVQITEGVDFFEDFGSLEDDGNYTGFFKGYLICSKMPETNGKPVKIKAYVSFMLGDQILVDTKECIFARPASNDLNLVTIRSKVGTNIKDALYKTYSVSGLSGVYASCIVPIRNADATLEKFAWVVDSDNDLVIKYAINELFLTEITRIDLKTISPNASPAHIASDMEGNVWVCLHDSLSTVRINNLTNTIDKYIVCNVPNSIINDENKIRPASIDVDVGNNVWISYSSDSYSLVERYNFDGVYLNGFTTSNLIPNSAQFTELVTDVQSNCYVIAKRQNSDVVYKITKDFQTSIINVGGNLGNINLDLAGNIWLTKDINKVVSIGLNGSIREYSLPTAHANTPNYYLSDLEGIATTTDGSILVIDDSRKGIHYFNYNDNPNDFVPKFIRIRQTPSSGLIANKLNGYGDWNGFRYINKFQHIYSDRYETTAYSNNFTLYSLEDKIYDIRKVNENFDPTEQLKSYRTQEYLLDKNVFFDQFLGTCIGNIDSDSNAPGKLIYEKIANFLDNNSNVDTCNVKSLKAINEMVDENLFIYNSREFEMPPELNRIFDLLTIKYSKLKGSRNKHEYNFDDKGYYGPIEERDTMYGINKGYEVDFNTYIVNINRPLVAYEKYSGTYKYINTKISQITLSSYDVFDNLVTEDAIPFIDTLNTLYPLSSCDTKWGWGLVLPEGIDDFKWKIPDYYKFYEFVPRYHYKNDLKDIGAQTEGVINWADPGNTIKEDDILSVSDWDKIKSDIIMYTLVKGLSNIK